MKFANTATRIMIETLNSGEKRELADYLRTNVELDKKVFHSGSIAGIRPYGFYLFVRRLAIALEVDAEADRENTIESVVNG